METVFSRKISFYGNQRILLERGNNIRRKLFDRSILWGEHILEGRTLWGEHFLREEHIRAEHFLWEEHFEENTVCEKNTLGRTLF